MLTFYGIFLVDYLSEEERSVAFASVEDEMWFKLALIRLVLPCLLTFEETRSSEQKK